MPSLNLAGRVAFDELLDGALSDAELSDLATDCAHKYVEHHTDPNSSILKIAKERELSPNAIDRLCEAVNVNVYSGMIKKAEPEERSNIRFPLADSSKIREELALADAPTLVIKEAFSDHEMMEKTASSHMISDNIDLMSDYLNAPPAHLSRADLPEDDFEKQAQVVPETLPHPKYFRMYFEKTANIEQELQGNALVTIDNMERDRGKFIKVARGLMITEAEKVTEIYKDACHIGLKKLATELITAAFESVKNSASLPWEVKLAGMAPDEYLPDNWPGRVINGEQRELRLLRGVDQYHRDLNNMVAQSRWIDHGRERMIERVRDLTSVPGR